MDVVVRTALELSLVSDAWDWPECGRLAATKRQKVRDGHNRVDYRLADEFIVDPAAVWADYVRIASRIGQRVVCPPEPIRDTPGRRPVPVRQRETGLVQHLAADLFEVVQIGPMPREEEPVPVGALV